MSQRTPGENNMGIERKNKRTTIISKKLSDGSEVYDVRLQSDDGAEINFAASDYAAAINLSAMFENADVVGCTIHSVTKTDTRKEP